jgi:hypothetical protein
MAEAEKTMESSEAIERDFKAKVADELRIVSEGINRFVVVTPMTFGDGDGLPIVLRKRNDGWYLTDEADTFLQLSYRLSDEELDEPPRKELIDRILSSFEIENKNGELILPIPDHRFGDALYTFIQALLKIDDIRYLSKERVQSTFLQDVRSYLEKIVTPQRITANWHDPERDRPGIYPVDYRVNGMKTPIFIFAINSEHKADIATISLLKFEQWKLNYKSVGIFDEMENFNQRTIARFVDACGKAYSTLDVAKESLPRFVPELLSSDG